MTHLLPPHTKLIDETRIARRITELGATIAKDYADADLVCIGVLKGASLFLADLVRAITRPVELEFIGVASYAGTRSTGHVRLTHDLTIDIDGRDVLIVEDIIDTGRTLDYLVDTLRVRNPRSIAVATFLSKPAVHQLASALDYVGFEIGEGFVVGYGLDVDQRYRNLPYVALLDATDC